MKGKRFWCAVLCAALCCCFVLGAVGCGGGNLEQLDHLQKQIEELNQKIGDLESEISTLKSANTALNNEINDAKGKLSAAETKLAATETALTTAEQERQTLTNRLSTLTQSAEENKTEIASLKTRIATLENDKQNHATEIADLKSKLQTCLSTQEQTQTKITELQTSLAEKATQIEQLQGDLAALDERVESLETSVAEQQKLLSDLTDYTYGNNGGKVYKIGDTVSYVANGVKYFDVTICADCHTSDGYEIAFKLNCDSLSNEIVNNLLHNNGRFLEGYIYDRTNHAISIGQSGLIPSDYPCPSYAPNSNGYFIWSSSNTFSSAGENLFFLYAGNSLIGIFDHITFPEENTNS